MLAEVIQSVRKQGVAATIRRIPENLAPNLYRKRRDYQVCGGLALLISHELRAKTGVFLPTNIERQLSVSALRRRQQGETSLNDYLKTAYRYSGFGSFASIRPMQIPAELRALAQIVDSHDPETVAEIGTARGGTFYLWCRLLDARIISIDLPEGDPRSIGPGPQFFREMDPDTPTSFVRGDSHDNGTKNELDHLLGDDDLDFLFIDGDHSYDGVKTDFEKYRALMADDGIIALHDIGSDWLDVSDYWKKLQSDYKTNESIIPSEEKSSRDTLGIGVVFLG